MSQTVTMTLTEFLLARIAEDEAEAQGWDLPKSRRPRVLAEAEAKRRIVDEYEQVHADYRVAHTPTLEGQRFGLLKATALLALPYADHPDYQEAWKP